MIYQDVVSFGAALLIGGNVTEATMWAGEVVVVQPGRELQVAFYGVGVEMRLPRWLEPLCSRQDVANQPNRSSYDFPALTFSQMASPPACRKLTPDPFEVTATMR